MFTHNKKSKIFTDIIEECANCFGGIPQLANAFDISPKAIYQWENNGIPKGRLFQLEILTSGTIKASSILKKQNQRKKNIYPPQQKNIPNKD